MERSKNIFDKIGSLIPGYRGYADRDSRRNCDKLLREEISQTLNNCSTIAKNRIKTEIKAKNLDAIQELEECRQKLNILSDKVKYAPYGESSFFSSDVIKEDELMSIYQFDHDISIFIIEFQKTLNSEKIENIFISIDTIASKLEKRNIYIKGHK